jgi:hypothetical protein
MSSPTRVGRNFSEIYSDLTAKIYDLPIYLQFALQLNRRLRGREVIFGLRFNCNRYSVCSLHRAKFPNIYPDLRLDYKVATHPSVVSHVNAGRADEQPTTPFLETLPFRSLLATCPPTRLGRHGAGRDPMQ